MPAASFSKEVRIQRLGLGAVKALAQTFGTSLTSTAIRYAELSPDPIAIIVSESDRVRYCFTSACLKQIRGLFIRRGTPLPPKSETARFNADPQNGQEAREAQSTSYLSHWFDDPGKDFEMMEDVIGLGRYGRTLTLLHAESIPEDEEEDET